MQTENIVTRTDAEDTSQETSLKLPITDIAGIERSLEEFAGHRILITTISTWNRSSHEQLALLQRVQEELGNDVIVIPWIVQQPSHVLSGILQRGQYNLTGFADKTGEDTTQLQSVIVPSHYFFNREGIMKQSISGFATTDQLLGVLQEIK